MKFKVFQFSILTLMIILIFSAATIFSQEQPPKEENKDILETSGIKEVGETLTASFKKALEETGAEKTKEKAKRDEAVSAKLISFMEEWLNNQRLKRKAELDTIIEQDWEAIIPTAPRYTSYYLRDFSYTEQSKDIIETTSVTSPYKSTVVVKEQLYVEQAPLIAEPRDNYQYTADTDIILSLEYDKNAKNWQIADIKQQMNDLRKGWPEGIAKKVGMYFIPKK